MTYTIHLYSYFTIHIDTYHPTCTLAFTHHNINSYSQFLYNYYTDHHTPVSLIISSPRNDPHYSNTPRSHCATDHEHSLDNPPPRQYYDTYLAPRHGHTLSSQNISILNKRQYLTSPNSLLPAPRITRRTREHTHLYRYPPYTFLAHPPHSPKME